jgi:nitrate/TMAO reductase-like tetraheme cytochrome c subunit
MNSSGRRRQAGFTVWEWLVIVLVGGFLLTLAFSIGPLYITNYTVRATVKALQNEPELASKSNYEVRLAVERKFDVNQIEVIQAVCRDKKLPCLKIEKTKTHLLIDANYEARTHVMGNVDAVVVFDDNRVEIPIPGAS